VEESIEDLAAKWLSAERAASERGDAADEPSRAASDAYDAAVRAATREELLVAWHAALRRESEVDMGSAEWADARRVSQLLNAEYQASE
jgi:hypothetical protein